MTMSRRSALAAMGAACVHTMSSRSATASAAAANASNIPFAFSLYGMKTLPLGRALRVCADIGYSGVELACMTGWPCDPAVLNLDQRKELRQQMETLSLELPCLMENLRLAVPEAEHRNNLERLKLVTQLAHDLRIGDRPPVIETVLGGRPDQWEMLKGPMLTALADWEKVAAKAGIILAIKAHVSGALHRPADVVWMVRQINSPWIKAAYDYSHFERQGLPLKASLLEVLPETVFIHIKDNLTLPDGKVEFVLPGDGTTDYHAYLRYLTEAKYQGAVCVEVSGQVWNKPDYNPIVAAERCYLNLRGAFEQAGLRARI